jgi:rhodanese-related sulfurtransferase
LAFRQEERRHEVRLRGRRVRRLADDADDLVDVRDGDEQAEDDVETFFRLALQEARAAADDLDAVVDVRDEKPLEIEGDADAPSTARAG